jgi:AhpD family alkylhydroperoxidase
MTNRAKEFFEDWPAQMRELNWQTPKIAKAFSELFHGLMEEGALSVREKELIALAIAMAVRCIPCINVHTEKAIRAGASREEVLEAAGVAVLMQGGPAYTYLPHVLDALDVLPREEKTQSPETHLHVVHSDSD